MPLRVLIVPDKFKGTLTAHQAAQAIARGWRQARPKDKLELLPMSDGGDGFGTVISELIGGVPRTVKTVDAAHRSCLAQWWWHPRTKTAVLETALVVGLAMLPPKRYHPFELDSFGLGKLVKAVARRGARRCLVGLGGSATNDGGFGLARSLGWLFLDRSANPINRWTDLSHLAEVRSPNNPLYLPELVVAVDVQNPLLGPSGATRIYGPQKGIRPTDVEPAENALGQLSRVVRGRHEIILDRVPGAGAAGGLGFGFLAFLGGRVAAGFDLFAREAKLKRMIGWADLVITGEGSIDHSTMMGKGAGCVAKLAIKLKVPCIGLCGLAAAGHRPNLFTEVHSLTEMTTENQAKTNPIAWLARLSNRVATSWNGRPIMQPPTKT